MQTKETVAKVDDIRVLGTAPPHMKYLHDLAAYGQGSSYDWDHNVVMINILTIDRTKEPTLKDVDRIELEYEKRK